MALLGKGTGVNRGDCGGSPLHTACKSDLAEVVNTLLEKGADVHAKNAYQHTPLGRAMEGGACCGGRDAAGERCGRVGRSRI